MDVTLVLTHRCNLACGYCYAGEHYRRDMDDETLDSAVDLLFSDRAEVAQLGFFGGEPFLAHSSMKRAIGRASWKARERGTRLLLQCTTNGTVLDDDHVAFIKETEMGVTVSIDGVREAHDLHRPKAGGGSSFDQAERGLKKLLSAGIPVDAMMVISPQTVPYVYQSASWLWSEGVKKIRANLVLDATWYATDKTELIEQLRAISWELLGRRLSGEAVMFEPFLPGLREVMPARQVGKSVPKRAQVVVATGGNLYPCSPMVGEDRDDGPEAALRIGRLEDGPDAIASRVKAKGAGCGDKKKCACAAYLETGDRYTAGPNGVWFGTVCAEMGRTVGKGLLESQGRRIRRRPLLIGIGALAAGVAAGVPAMIKAGFFGADEGCERPIPGRIASPEPIDITTRGELIATPPEPEPEPEPVLPGDPGPPPDPEPEVDGDIGMMPEEVHHTAGVMVIVDPDSVD